MRRVSLRAGLVLAIAFVAGAMLAIACSDEQSTPGTIAADASANQLDAGAPQESDDDDDTAGEDAGKDAGKDAGRKVKPLQRDAAGPGGEGDTCSFNWDCQLGLRCECADECACATGARGKGKPGGKCADANDCVSALCLDGPNDELLCSDECAKDENCPDLLPVCTSVALVGRFCARIPPK
ncbi:MAG: hypothetical protein U0270_01865 [Labilithrix sp.]